MITKPVVVYYPVGTVHMRNLALLAQALPDFRFRVFYRTRQPWFAPDKVQHYPYEHVYDLDDRPAPELFAGDVWALILSIAAVDRLIADLIEGAFEREIPVIAIEEVIQLALNQGVINHYLMPVDHLLVASDYERSAFLRLGVLPEKVRATGWPFYSGLISQASPERRQALRQRWNLPQNKLIATLCLSQLKIGGRDLSTLETLTVRQRLLATVKQGLPDRFHLIIKQHPTEDAATARKTIRPYFSDATIIRGSAGIDEVLDVTDVCLNRGNSQVVIEALLRGLPVLALPCGIPTLFDGLADQVVIGSPAQLKQVLNHLAQGRTFDYQPVMETHFPWTPEQALQRTARRVQEIVATRALAGGEQKWLDLALYRGLMGDGQAGIRLLDRMPVQSQTSRGLTAGLRHLLRLQATMADLEMLLSNLSAPYQQPLVLSLWIQQLYQSRRVPNAQELAIIERDAVYAPQVNPHDYVKYAVMLGYLYLRAGDIESAQQLVTRLEEQYGFLGTVRDLAARTDLARGYFNVSVIKYLGRKGKHYLKMPLRFARRVARKILKSRREQVQS